MINSSGNFFNQLTNLTIIQIIVIQEKQKILRFHKRNHEMFGF